MVEVAASGTPASSRASQLVEVLVRKTERHGRLSVGSGEEVASIRGYRLPVPTADAKVEIDLDLDIDLEIDFDLDIDSDLENRPRGATPRRAQDAGQRRATCSLSCEALYLPARHFGPGM